jgi:SIR2-like domain
MPFNFSLTFGGDLAEQQRYIADVLSPDKIALNIGHRALAALLDAGLARVIFGSNFDDVVERAYAFVAGKALTAFHLEGSYAALDALNVERYPLYAKVHGDFRYQSIRNLPPDLIRNDTEIQKCFLAASTRFGMIVSGYSGRDRNVMSMFRAALDQSNAFPLGLFWTAPRLGDVSQSVQDLIALARGKNVNAYLVEAGTFDTMLVRFCGDSSSKSPRTLKRRSTPQRLSQ